MWQIKLIKQTEHAIRFGILMDGVVLKFMDVITLWKHSHEFRTFYIHLLAQNDFTGFYWEHPPLRESVINRPYECVILNSSSLEKRTLNETAFADFFNTTDLVVNFDNLGKNARLIVPTPKDDIAFYKHLAKFIRSNKTDQQQALFEKIGDLVLHHLETNSEKTIWLNTAGNGVLWLHIRLDSRPKYYKTQAYRNPDFLQNKPI